MKFKRILSSIMCVVMLSAFVPCGISTLAAETSTVINNLGGVVLFSAPDGEYYNAAAEDVFTDWRSNVNAGYVNIRTYTEGVTLQYYVDGSNTSLNHSSTITSPGYGSGSDKVIIEWKMRHDTANDLYFDFSFKDINNVEIAYLKLDKNAVDPGRTHPDANNDELYAMGFPDTGDDCAIVAYNNSDGSTHTVDYYVNGEILTTLTDVNGKIDGFKSIVSSNGSWSTGYKHIGFTDLTIGAVYDNGYKEIVAEYIADGDVIKTIRRVFPASYSSYSYFSGMTIVHNGDVYSCGGVELYESKRIVLTKLERYSTKEIGEVFELDGIKYVVKTESAIANGNFGSGDLHLWTNRMGTDLEGVTSFAYDSEVDGFAISITPGGSTDPNSIGTSWKVEAGKKYYASFYVGGVKPESHNYKYNNLFDGDKTTSLIPYGEEMTNNEWTHFERIIQPSHDSVYFQSSWAAGVMKFANFELLQVEEYAEEPTEPETETPTEPETEEPTEEVTEPEIKEMVFPVVEDAFVRYSTIYGIENTNTDGVLIASSNDVNRGPEKDANGETTYLNGSTPTTLGSTRVGLMKFNIRELSENEKATLKFYVREWHSQGFDGGNTFLKIAATPLENSSWAQLGEGDSIAIENESLLSNWNTPIFSKAAYKGDEIVEIDVTEAVRAARLLGMNELSFKLQIYWGAAYVIEREATESGDYEGKAAFIEITEDDNLKKLTTSGSAVLTKNGSVVNTFAYVTDSDDVRLQLDSAYAIGSDAGYYFPNEKLTFTENTDITETIALDLGINMIDGAQVRFGGGLDEYGNVGTGNGLRFITTVNRTDTLCGVSDAEIGVTVRAEASDAEQEIVAEKWQDMNTFTVAITNLSVNNYNRKYTATPYVRVGGRKFEGEGVTRSMYQVASGLLVRGSTDNTEYPDEAMNNRFYDVLNAYVNQVGIRLTFSDNPTFTDWELRIRDGGKGAYTGDAFFEISETKIDGKKYSVVLRPLGDRTVIRTDNNYWNNYVRVNNNNSSVKLVTNLIDNGDGTYTLEFDTTKLIMGTYPEEKFNSMKPTYESAVNAMQKANEFWQNYQSYDNWYGGTHPAFWDKAAYHTGNVEYYLLTDDDQYLQYTIDWAEYNNWMGNNNTSADPSQWTWSYNQTQGSNAVIFGDWQTCFQVYIDLYNSGIEGANIDRVYEVIDYQISTDRDGYWWWADALYMVMPTMTKLYLLTGDEAYLDALYKYFKYAKELMYDGVGGIPTDSSGYTTSASLTSGANYSDPDDYKNLFFRDAGYVYPLNPNSGHENEKNFWARGNGWVFAALAKVLNDMPDTYEHYDEFYTTYVEMAEAIVGCQQIDEAGYGFWTQSMLQDYPKGTNGNDEGYETSGSAFLTYGLFWGVNNGILVDKKYEYAAIRGWGYLENIALLEDGKVGYVQPIGSNATSATPQSTTVNFGVGAFLLAGCEAARWANNQ